MNQKFTGTLLLTLMAISPVTYAVPDDMDNDGVPNSYDADIDGDGIPNVYEQYNDQLKYRSPFDGYRDADRDGWTNTEEYRHVTLYNDATSNPATITGPELFKTFGFDAATGSQFGYSVALDGDWAVIGAPHAPSIYDSQGNAIDPVQTGAVYVYHFAAETWTLQAKLTASSEDDATGNMEVLEAGAEFGHNVALTLMPESLLPTVMVTAPGIDSVFVFKSFKGNWEQTGEIKGPADIGFADSLALDNTTAIIGAPNALPDDAGFLDPPVGKVFVYNVFLPNENLAPIQVAEISYCENGYECSFGKQVALENDTLVVSSPTVINNDYVYVYRNFSGVWTQEAELDSAISTGDNFGASIALSGDRILISNNYSDAFFPRGDLFEFTRSGSAWTEQGTVLASDLGSDVLGQSIALSGDTLVVSDDAGDVIGLKKIGDAWTELVRNNPGLVDDDAKHFLAVDEITGAALVGAPEDIDGGEDAGAAYFVDLNTLP